MTSKNHKITGGILKKIILIAFFIIGFNNITRAQSSCPIEVNPDDSICGLTTYYFPLAPIEGNYDK